MKIIKFLTSVSRRLVPFPPPCLPSTPLSIQPSPSTEKEEPRPSTSSAPPVPPKPKKRALLIGIQANPEERAEEEAQFCKRKGKSKAKSKQKGGTHALKGCHKDVLDLKQVLIELYGYNPNDITVLIDKNESNQLQPTLHNIDEKMQELVADAEYGDQFFFHFAGHSTQKDSNSLDEEDGKDEFIVTLDNQMIMDDDLHKALVKPLPVGSRLVAVFDTCHSASLLDLKHFRCNRVYVPWINKGRRRSNTKWNDIVRRQAAPLSPGVSQKRFQPGRLSAANPRWKQSSIDQILNPTPIVTPSSSNPPELPKKVSLTAQSKSLSVQTDVVWFDSDQSPMQRCVSPEEIFCSGFCKLEPHAKLISPQVISLSAAKDGQRAWEDDTGASMTQSLIKILRCKPNPTLFELLTFISHDLHTVYVRLHARSRDYKKRFKLANTLAKARGKAPRQAEAVEMDNFQDPQISSIHPLDMKNERWRL